MDPPKFEEVGKKSNDILSGFFDTGNFSIKVKSVEGVNEFMFSNQLDHNSKTMIGSKMLLPNGMQLMQKWNSDNVLFTDLSLKDALGRGTKLGATGSFRTNTGLMSGALKFLLRRDNLRLDLNMLNEDDRLKVNNEVSLRFNDQWFLVGHFNGAATQEQWCQNRNYAIGFTDSNFELTMITRNMHDFRATLYQQTCGPMDIANRLYFNGEKTHFEVGFLFKNGCNSTTVKFDTNANISLGHQMQLSSAVLLKLWASFDGKNKLQESCKVGIGINLNF